MSYLIRYIYHEDRFCHWLKSQAVRENAECVYSVCIFWYHLAVVESLIDRAYLFLYFCRSPPPSPLPLRRSSFSLQPTFSVDRPSFLPLPFLFHFLFSLRLSSSAEYLFLRCSCLTMFLQHLILTSFRDIQRYIWFVFGTGG